jgi:D-amino-acid dehydrogenase
MASRDTVIVVGAGHIGIACAHYLARDGFEVTVIDQGDIGGACSQANCGFLVPSHVLPLTTPDALTEGLFSVVQPRAAFRIKPQFRRSLLRWMLQFASRCTQRHMLEAANVLHAILEASIAEYRTLLADPQLESEWQSNGLLLVFEGERALGDYGDTDVLLTREFGVTARYLNSDELAAFEPALLDGLAGAYLYENDGHLRPDRLNASWSSMLRAQGVRFVEGCRLEQVTKGNGEITGLVTSQGRMRADRYVFATGAWSGKWSYDLECRIPVEPGKGYSVTMTKPATMPAHPMLMPEKHIGVTPFEKGYRIASMMEFVGFDDSIPPFRIQQLQDSAKPFLKEPVGPAIENRWYGWRPMTWDSLPIVGRLPSVKNALIATGHNMLGLTLAPVTGRLIADLVSERDSELPVQALSPARFL